MTDLLSFRNSGHPEAALAACHYDERLHTQIDMHWVHNRLADPADIELRNRTYHRFVELGRAPTATEMARTRGVSRLGLVGDFWRLG